MKKAQILRHMEARMKRLDGRIKGVASKQESRVIGMDIYVQAEEPQASGDYIWIDTKGIDLVIQ